MSPEVKELLPESPFPRAGKLRLKTGEDLFVKFETHEDLKDEIIKRRIRDVSMWALAGPTGIGRTWTMSWLAREARSQNLGQDERWEVAMVPGLGGGGSTRAVFESIFDSTSYLRGAVHEAQVEEDTILADPSGGDPAEEILSHALHDDATWSVFTGDRGRFPPLDPVPQKPKWTKRSTQLEFLALWFQELREIGVDNLLILIDEFEILVTLLGKKKLVELSDGLRSFFDEVESEGTDVPNIQVVLSMTAEVATRTDPHSETQELAGWIDPLRTRMDPTFKLDPMGLEDAHQIVEHAMDVKRTEDMDDPIFPYTEDAIELAYEASDRLPREFTKILNEMHQAGYSSDSLDTEACEEALKILGRSVSREP